MPEQDDAGNEPMQGQPELRRQVAHASREALGARGPDGERVLRWLLGTPRPEDRGPLLESLSGFNAPFGSARASEALDLERVVDLSGVQRAVVLGDVHGRWDAARSALRVHGVIDAQDRWCAPPGTWLIQMGDLLDADLTSSYSQREDPLARALLDAYRPWVEAALSTAPVNDAARELMEGWLGSPEIEKAPLWWRMRHNMVCAALSWHTLHAFMRLEREARVQGGGVLVLAGNHEADLLSGRFWWYATQKHQLLALEGLSAEEPGQWAESEVLAWLSRRPVMARVGRMLLVHGGPTRALVEETRGIGEFAVLAAHIEQESAGGWASGFYEEGRSLLSPERRNEDCVREPELLEPWLEVAECDFLVVGHSPFLGFAPDSWLDPQSARVAERLGRIERLGPLGNVLAVDSNLKRGSRCELLELDAGRGVLDALEPEGGHRTLLGPDEQLLHPAGSHRVLAWRRTIVELVDASGRGPALVDLRPIGLDARALSEVMPLVDAVETRHGSAFRRDYGGILRAGPEHLQHVQRILEEALDNPNRLKALSQHREALEERIRGLAQGLVRSKERTLRYYIDLRDGTVEGVRYRLTESVLEATWAMERGLGERLRAAVTAQLVVVDGEPSVRLCVFRPGEAASVNESVVPLSEEGSFSSRASWSALEGLAHRLLGEVSLDAWQERSPAGSSDAVGVGASAGPVRAGESSNPRRVRGPASSATRPAVSAEALSRFLELNRARLLHFAQGSSEFLVEGVDIEPCFRPGFFEVRGPWPRCRGLVTGDGLLVLADTTFVHPGASFQALELDPRGQAIGGSPMEHHKALWKRWQPPERIRLYSHLKAAVAARLWAGDVEQLRVLSSKEKRRSWEGGCFVFTSPQEAAARSFSALNPHRVVFEIPRSALWQLLGSGLAQLNVMLEDEGAVLDPSQRWGVPSAALEVVALGADGVRALWSWVEPEGSRVG